MSERIESVLQEGRRFRPPERFRKHVRIADAATY